ncbi:aldose epimerase [Cupriavidus sp. AU9028]|uniref:aldose epimerase family protein n=1 Tax=Cupriavidus sp. AU9028 TaxID=2871157 RepID=UPI001C956210|nr:aldose epimerase [Cupriavidus sp. AU9028]MBY4898151.1 aldose epimerase [Cupriavidus sp. AU9028]
MSAPRPSADDLHRATVRFQQQPLVRLGDERNMLLLAPQAGGRLVRWVHRGIDLLHWPDPADWTRPAKIRGGNPLLFPLIGRHFVDGEAGRWRDPLGKVHAMPQHGFARDLPFEVATLDPTGSITMSLADSAATREAYPFAFRFEVGYRLLPDGLEAVFEVHNLGDTPLPFQAGHHFYFAVPAALRSQCRLAMPPAERLRQRADGGLTEAEAGESVYALDDPRLQDTFHRLAGNGRGPALSIPAAGARPALTLAFDLAPKTPDALAWHAMTTWAEHEQADHYCVEPWLGLPDGVHRGEALRVAPGNSVRAACRIGVRID